MREAAPDFDDDFPAGADISDHGAMLSQAKPRVWGVGALCKAVADALDARFNPVTVRGEISGFSRAASGHCYFNLKDASGQIRCAMFRRAATLVNFSPRDGELVEVRGKLGVYEQRGDLQLIVESMQKAGQGALFEQFLRLKTQLESEGLFDADRKRAIPLSPRGIGVVTSLGAAALHDVVTALQRRVPHIPVVISPAAVQGVQASGELVDALSKLYQLALIQPGLEADLPYKNPVIDVILLVRGGGSMEDLWAFNDERLARTIAQSPVPLICGVGHETDFSMADFCADLRAPTPTAAAELCATERIVWLGATQLMQDRLQSAVQTVLDKQAQRIDISAQRLGRPSDAMAQQRLLLQRLEHNLQRKTLSKYELLAQRLLELERDLPLKTTEQLRQHTDRLHRAQRSLQLLDPQRVLERGYAVLQDSAGAVVGTAKTAKPGQKLTATLHDGKIGVTVH